MDYTQITSSHSIFDFCKGLVRIMQLLELIKWHLFKSKSTENISLNWVGHFPNLKKLFGRIIFPVIERLRIKGSHHYRHQVLSWDRIRAKRKRNMKRRARKVRLWIELKRRIIAERVRSFRFSVLNNHNNGTMATTKTNRINFTIHAKTINDNNNNDDNYNDDENG